jgi:hypothetical protein
MDTNKLIICLDPLIDFMLGWLGWQQRLHSCTDRPVDESICRQVVLHRRVPPRQTELINPNREMPVRSPPQGVVLHAKVGKVG